MSQQHKIPTVPGRTPDERDAVVVWGLTYLYLFLEFVETAKGGEVIFSKKTRQSYFFWILEISDWLMTQSWAATNQKLAKLKKSSPKIWFDEFFESMYLNVF